MNYKSHIQFVAKAGVTGPTASLVDVIHVYIKLNFVDLRKWERGDYLIKN